MENNLLNINGEYVKFYITTNSNIPYILKNSGSIVIYHDKNNALSNGLIPFSYSLNYIYLGNEIIASGYGLSNIDLRNKSEEIAVNYDERQNEINTYFSEVKNDILYLYNNILTYNGNLQYTYITTYDNTISTDEYLFNTVNAKYKEAEIVNEKTIITYYSISDPANLYKFYNEIAFNVDINDYSTLNTVISYSNEPIKLPIGAKINSFTKEFTVKLNDESGIYSNNSLSYSFLSQEDCVLNPNFENTNYKESFITLSLEEISQINLYKIKYNYSPIINGRLYNQFYVKEGLTYLASQMNIRTIGTQNNKLSYYSYFDTKTNTNILSKENSILPHTLTLHPIIIEGCPTLYSYQSKTSNESISFIEDGLMFGGYGNRTLLEDITKLQISKDTYILYFALPYNTIIEEIYYIDYSSNCKINITGTIVDLHIQNPIKKYPYNINQNTNGNNAAYPYYDYKFYMLKYNDDVFGNDMTIYIKTSNTDLTSYNKQITNEIAPNILTWTSVQNENYLLTNWIKCKTHKNDNTLFNLLGITKKYYTYNDKVFEDPITYWESLNDLIYMENGNYKNLINNDLNLDINSNVLIIPNEYVTTCQFVLSNYNDNKNVVTTHINDNSWEKDIYVFNKLDSQYCKLISKKYNIVTIVYNDYILIDKNYIGDTNDLYTELLNNGKILESHNIYQKININDLDGYIYLPYNYKISITYKLNNNIVELKLNQLKTVKIGTKDYNIYQINEFNHIKQLINDKEITMQVLRVKI